MNIDTSSLVVITASFKVDSKQKYRDIIGVVTSRNTILTIPNALRDVDGATDMKFYLMSSTTFKSNPNGTEQFTGYTVTNSSDNRLIVITLPKDISEYDDNLTVSNLSVIGDKKNYRIPIFRNGKWYVRSVLKLKEENNYIFVRSITNTDNMFGVPVIDSDNNVVGIAVTHDGTYTWVIPIEKQLLNWIHSLGSDSESELEDEIITDIWSSSKINVNPDYTVQYSTEEDGLTTSTDFDLPDKVLDFRELSVTNDSVSGNYSKREDNFAKSDSSIVESLYDKLFPTQTLLSYLKHPISQNVKSTILQMIQSKDPRLGLLVDSIKTYSDLLQWLVNFKWSRFNILDKYMSFTEYMDFVSSLVSGLKVPNNFPVLVTKNTVNKMKLNRSSCCPHSVDYKSKSVVYTSGDYKATMETDSGKITSNSINMINLSCYTDRNWLITNKSNSIEFKATDNTTKYVKTGYSIMAITGLEYKDKYIVIYLISGYSEHTLILDYNFNLLEDVISEIFPEEIVKLLDPKSYIFRDKYQYYVNTDDSKFVTFPLTTMLDMYNRVVNKFTIVNTELVQPRPVTISDYSPRINTKYGKMYNVMWSYTDSINMMTILPAIGYTFDKNNFYNPRKYLTNSDYDEACIPLHKGFIRTEVYPWFWRSNGLTWHNGYYGYNNYYGLYYSYWNSYWWFFS